ncbi:MAG TPA: hypothetical protein VF363_03415 [Candidatus Eisenbacteria bacterium]
MGLLILAAGARPADAGALESTPKERPAIIGITIGARLFTKELELGNDFAFGGRVGLGLSRRWALLLDFVAAHTYREPTGKAAYVDALRVLGRANLLTGRFRPYVLAGPGGLLFLLNDTPTTAGGAATFGLGADYRLAPQTFGFVESSIDLYSQQDITYSLDGSVSFVGPNRARTLGAVIAGIGVEF